MCERLNQIREGESEGIWAITYKDKTVMLCHAHYHHVKRLEEVEHFQKGNEFDEVFNPPKRVK